MSAPIASLQQIKQTCSYTITGTVGGFLAGHAINSICKKNICNPYAVASGMATLNILGMLTHGVFLVTKKHLERNSLAAASLDLGVRFINCTLAGLAVVRLRELQREKVYCYTVCSFSALGWVILRRV